MILKDFRRGYGESFMITGVAAVERHQSHDHEVPHVQAGAPDPACTLGK